MHMDSLKRTDGDEAVGVGGDVDDNVGGVMERGVEQQLDLLKKIKADGQKETRGGGVNECVYSDL